MLEQLNEQIKTAMKAKDQVRLRGLRLIKSAIMLLHAEGGSGPSAEDEMAALVKMAKQRKDSIDVYLKEGRDDLAAKEQEELDIISEFLPEQMSEEAIRESLKSIIADTGAEGMKDMGKVMGRATQEMKGRADGKLISQIVKELLA